MHTKVILKDPAIDMDRKIAECFVRLKFLGERKIPADQHLGRDWFFEDFFEMGFLGLQFITAVGKRVEIKFYTRLPAECKETRNAQLVQ
jgi:hypothetical protein